MEMLESYIHQIQRYALLTREEEAEISKRIENGDRAAVTKLVNSNLVDDIIAKYTVLINNLAISHFAKRIVLHNFKLDEKQFDYVKREMIRLVSEEIADRVVLSKLDGKNNFLGGCALIIQDNFYVRGGMQ